MEDPGIKTTVLVKRIVRQRDAGHWRIVLGERKDGCWVVVANDTLRVRGPMVMAFRPSRGTQAAELYDCAVEADLDKWSEGKNVHGTDRIH